MCGRVRRRERALSLLEMLITVAVLTTGLVSVSYALSTAMKSSRLARSYADAMYLAEQTLSEVEARTRMQYGNTSGSFEGDFSRYRWELALSRTDDEDVAAVRVRILWDTAQGERDYVLTTLLRHKLTIRG